jgi:hypothetical protein
MWILENAPKNANDHEQRRAYIRRSQAIQWSYRLRSCQASTSPLVSEIGTAGGFRKGQSQQATRLPRNFRTELVNVGQFD